MNLSPEDIGRVVKGVSVEAVADKIEEGLGRELTDEEYRSLSESVEAALTTALTEWSTSFPGV